MNRGPAGRIIQIGGGAASFGAFLPSPLPPAEPIRLRGALLLLFERAAAALGSLDSLTTLLPEPDLFLYSYVRREAVLSSQIEGTKSTLNELLLFELAEAPGAPFDEVVEVSNYVQAMEHGLKLLRGGLPLCNRLVREVHRVLLSRGRGADKAPGKFRRAQVWIGGSNPRNAAFIPPPEGEVEQCMADLERFLNATDDGLPALLRAGMAHAQFETIHPFMDGNGRVGRMLIALSLCQSNLMREPLLYLSLYLRQNREQYFKLLDRTRSEGEWEEWLEFFLTAVLKTAGTATNAARRLVQRFDKDSKRIQGMQRGASRALRVFNALQKRPVLSVSRTVAMSGLSYPTANSAFGDLVRLGIVKELTGGSYGRAFGYTGYLKILNEEPKWAE